MQSREEKFKKYREELAYEIEKPHDEIEELEIEDEEVQLENHRKKNTLTMSIDELLEAHDEYTMIIEKKQLSERIKKEKREQNISKIKTILRYIGIGLILLLMVVVIVIIILSIWR